nr:hypothetical protein Hi04_10k_c1074_00020 [uncultured bacterium]
MDDRPNIILSPHFDDAVFSLGGFIAASPDRAVVVTVFAGSPADNVTGRWDRRSGFKTAAAAMRTRARENEAALSVLGVPPGHVVNLDFLDDQYRAAPVAQLLTAIADAISGLVSDFNGSINLFTPASDWHPDHRLVTDAVITAWSAGRLLDTEVFLYQDQPYAYLELRKRSLTPLRFAAFSGAANHCRVPAEPHWLEFDETANAKKRQAAAQYKSQFPVIRPLLCKMIDDFSRYQTHAAGRTAHRAELAYRLVSASRS